jgi:hypothetical protein
MQRTDEEIAGSFGISVRTSQNRRAQRKFGDAMRRGKAGGLIGVRRFSQATRAMRPCPGKPSELQVFETRRLRDLDMTLVSKREGVLGTAFRAMQPSGKTSVRQPTNSRPGSIFPAKSSFLPDYPM